MRSIKLKNEITVKIGSLHIWVDEFRVGTSNLDGKDFLIFSYNGVGFGNLKKNEYRLKFLINIHGVNSYEMLEVK